MSSIGSLFGNSYNQSLTGNAKSKDEAEKTNASAPSLADVLTGKPSAAQGDAYTLSLSQEAQKMLAAARTEQMQQSSSDSFTLNKYQQQAFDRIIAKYSDKPLTNENYEALQNDLYDAALSPEQLSLMNNVTRFSSTQTLVDMLNGKAPTMNTNDFFKSFGQLDEARAEKYLDGVVLAWQKAYDAANPLENKTETSPENANADSNQESTVEDSGQSST